VKPVGQFRVTLTLHPRDGGTPQRLDALVDTGAGYSVVPRAILESLRCRPIRAQRVILADGRVEEWSVGQIDVECEGRRAVTPVLMGPPEGPVLLGATTLEELGLGIDPLNRRLVPVDLYLA
jgi:clan AA aspartic protease